MGDKNGFTPRNRGGFRGRNGYDNRSNSRGRGGGRGRGGARGRGGMRGRGAPRMHGAQRGLPQTGSTVNRETTVLVKNLPSHAADWQTKLTALFKDCGPVEKMEFVKNGPRDEGVFTFSQEESVEKALAVHGSLLEGRHIIVDLPEKNDQKYEPTSCKVDAGADVIEEDIWQLLESCGTIKAIRLKHDSRKAHVLFETEEAVQAALALNGTELNGAPCSILRWRSWRSCQEQSLGVAVFGLLHRVSRDDVTEYFKDCGNICSVWVEFPRDSSIRRALLVFEEEEGARKALEKDGTLLGKDTIRVRPWDGRKFINAVFIGGVPFGLASTDLWKVFQTCGTIDNVHFDRFNQSYAARRACVEFEDAASVKNALGLDGIEIKGKRIKVFHSLDEWDQHLADYKEARDKAREGAEEESKEEAEADGEGEAEAEGEPEADGADGADGDAEIEGEGEPVDGEVDGEGEPPAEGNGDAEIKEEPLDNGIKAPGKRKAYQGNQARNKARKLR